MKCTQDMRKALIYTPVVFLSVSIALLQPVSIIQSQSVALLPTMIDTSSTPLDVTVPTVGGDLLVGSGDFNGDGFRDLLFEKIPADVSSSQEAIDGVTILFGTPGLTAPGLGAPGIAPQSPPNALTFGLGDHTAFGRTLRAESLPALSGGRGNDLALTEFSGHDYSDRVINAVHIVFGSGQLRPGTTGSLHPDLNLIFLSTVSDFHVVGAADVNGDGVRDLVFITNDRLHYVDRTAPNRVNVLLGPFHSGETIDLRERRPDIVIVDPQGDLDSATLADLNGDGISDLLIGRSGIAHIGPGENEIEVLLGSQELVSHAGTITLPIPASEGVIITGSRWISTGDFNGDGIDDVVLSDNTAERAAAAVVFGSPEIRGRVIRVDKNQQDVTIEGFQNALYAQFAGILVADFNGDGIADILISALTRPLDGDTGKRISGVYGILGSRDWKHGDSVDISRFEQDLTILGTDERSVLLGPVNADVNGDGAADILVGDDFDMTLAGRSPLGRPLHVIFGGQVMPPAISTATFSKRTLMLTGANFTGAAQIKVNGTMIDRPPVFSPATGTLIVKGGAAALNLHRGPNQIVVVRRGSESSPFDLER